MIQKLVAMATLRWMVVLVKVQVVEGEVVEDEVQVVEGEVKAVEGKVQVVEGEVQVVEGEVQGVGDEVQVGMGRAKVLVVIGMLRKQWTREVTLIRMLKIIFLNSHLNVHLEITFPDLSWGMWWPQQWSSSSCFLLLS